MILISILKLILVKSEIQMPKRCVFKRMPKCLNAVFDRYCVPGSIGSFHKLKVGDLYVAGPGIVVPDIVF